ncbi:MAG: hypothetical protein ACT4QE_16975 [Anaerolineales bacterium]
MKRLIVTSLGFGILTACAGLSLLAMIALDPARYPGSLRISDTHFDLRSADKGYISRASVYQTDADVMSVWRWYARQFDVAPKDGMGAEGQYVMLEKIEQAILLLRTIGVRVCPVESGTRVVFNQTVYLRPDFSVR